MNRKSQARALLSSALLEAMGKVNASHANAAKWMSVNTKTVARWVHEQAPINVERVLSSPKLGTTFLEALSARTAAVRKERADG